MSKVSRNFLLLVLTLFLVMTPIVLGANILDNVLKPFAGINIGDTYQNHGYAPFIDAIIYFILFIGIASAGLGQTFKDNKSISVIVGIMLAVGMTVFELNTGFNIGKFAPVAALIFFLVIGIFIYNLIKNLTDQTFAAVSLAFLVMYGLVQAMSPALLKWIEDVPWLGTVISLMLVASIIGLIYGIISLFKGIKSGSWGANRTERAEQRTNKEFANKEKREEKALKKEKDAAQKMFKLETELGNINNSIAELERAEANIAVRDHTNREHQIQTLKELESALNGSWRLQQQLQDAYSKASRPEYSSNQQYLENIKTASRQLDDFINRIRFHLTTLVSAIEQSKNLYETDTLKVEQEITSKVSALSSISAQSIAIDNELSKLTAKLNRVGLAEDPNAVKNITDALKTNIEARPLIEKIISSNTTIANAQRDIHNLDSRNINELKKAISVAETNPAKDIGLLRKGLNIGMNTDTIKAEMTENKGTINTIANVINTGYKYLSGDSLRQMYETVKSVHLNTVKILNELMPLENTNKLERTKDINNCIAIMNKDNQIIAKNIADLMLKDDENARRDIAEMTRLKDYLTKVLNEYKTFVANINKNSPAAKELTEQMTEMVTSSINALKLELDNSVLKLPNEEVKTLLIETIRDIIVMLDQLVKIPPKDLKLNKENTRLLYVKSLDQIIIDLDSGIKKQIEIYTTIRTTLQGENNLKTLSNNLSNTAIPQFNNTGTAATPIAGTPTST